MAGLPRVQQAVLEVLAQADRTHAYDVKRSLKGRIGHASIYAALSAMQAKGYLTADWELPGTGGSPSGGPPRKYFEITAEGRRALAEPQATSRYTPETGRAAIAETRV